MHFSGRVKNLVSRFLSVPAGVRGVVLFALMLFTGMGNVWGETYSSDKTITYSDFAEWDTIIINNNAKLTINLMGQNVTVATINIGNGSSGNLLINGPGTLNVGIFDPDEYVPNRIEINNYANLVVTGTFYADKGYGAAADAVTIITGDRTGSLSISNTGKVDYSEKNDSGVFFDTVNVNVLSDSDIDNLVKYSWDSIKASISEGIGITVKRTFKGQANKESIFYKVVFSNSTRADINGSVEFAKETGVTESKTVSKDILISFNTDPSGEHDFENTGDSAILTLYAPDGVTELATVAYYYQRPVWNGSESTDGYDVKNWGLAAGTAESELLEFFKSNQIMLNSGLSSYPVFRDAEKSVEFKSLVVSSGASVTVSAGELIAGELSVKGSGVLNTNGGKITISGNSTISNLNLGSEMKVTDGTTVITSLKTNRNCSVEISSGAEVYVTNSYLGENCPGKLSWTGTGTLTIPRSGANVDFGAEVPDYGEKLDVKAAGAATYYSANDLTADGSLILTRVSGSSTGSVSYPYTLNTTTVTKKVNIGGMEYNSSSSKTGYFEVPSGSANKSFTVSGLLNIDENSSFIMTFYSPDRKFSLGSISYTKTSSGYLWTGNSSSDWSVRDNWSGLDASEQPDRMAGKTLIVDYANFTGNKKYPNINNTSTAGTIIIKNGAYITANNNNELTVGKILCMGDAYFSATQGCVIFSDDVIPSDDVNFSDGASFTAANPDKSKFNNVKIDGNFTANSKMSVAENFSAENLGGYKITLNDNVIVGGNLFLSGTVTDTGIVKLLTITGDEGNYFKISNTQNYGLYLKVEDGLKIGENGGSSSVVYKAYNCDRNSAANEKPFGWVLSTGKPDEFIWTGLKSTEWDNEENWSPKISPVEPDVINPDVIIPDGLNNYPKLTDAIKVKSICIGEKEGTNAKIELNGFGFKVTGTTAGAFTNYGTVVCIGQELDNVKMPAESGAVVENGTWQFNGNGATVKKIENHTYKNILISNRVNISGDNRDNGDIAAEKITVSTTSQQKHSVTSSVKITADVVLDTDSQFDTSGNNGFAITGNISGGKSLQILSSGTFNITGNADVGNFSTSGNAVFAGNLTASGTISVSGNTQFEGNEISICSGGTQTFSGKVTVNSDVELVAGTSGAPSSVIFNSTVDDGVSSDSDRHSIVIGSPSVESSAVFNGTVGGTSKLKKLQVNGSASGNGADPIVINSENSSFAAFKDGTNLTVNGNADIYGNNNFTSFTLTGNAVIYDSNTFTNIVIDNSGATAETTVKFENGTTQIIQNDWSGGNIPFKGAGEGKELVLTSIEPFISETPNPWNVVFTNSGISKENFSYVKVQNSKSVDSSDNENPLNLLQKKENVVSAGNTFDWFLKTIYKWLGTVDTKWSQKDNWRDENNSPVIAAPDYTTGMNEIIIDEASVNSLVFDDDDGIPEGTKLNLKSLKIPSSKKVCIADCYVTADSITVDGTIALFGTQANYPLGVNGGKVDWGADSTIEYYGSSAGAKDILCASVDSETGTQKYQNIKLSCGPILFEKALDVAGNFTNDSAGQITFAKNVKVASPVNFASPVALSGNVIFDVPAVTFKSAFNAGLISEDSAREIVFTGNVLSEGDFTAAAGITEFKGNVDFSGSNFIHNGGTVKISGTDNLLTVKTDGSTVFNNLTANSSKTTLNGAFSVIRDFLVETDVECEMNGALTISGNFTNNGTFKAGKSDSDSYELKIAKDFVNNGSFDAKSGTVLFTGTEISNISGETKWFNFKAETPGKTLIFQAGKIQEILNSLIIKGSASDDKSSNVVLKSSTDGEFWFIKTAVNDSNLSVDYASIKDSKCTEKSIVANNSDDLGNTSGWIFPGLMYTWVGNESDLWSVSKNWSPASLPGKFSCVLIPDGNIKADMDIEIQKLDLKPQATFDLASHKITINGSDNYLTNEGTIKLNGIENQVEAAVKNLPDSWIEYYGGTAENPSKNVIKEEYYNLKIYSDADFDNLSDNTDVPVIINGNLVLAESAKMTFEKNVQICGALIENGNNLVLKGNFEVANVQSENGKHISITFNGPVAGKTEQTLYYSSLSDKKSVNIQNLDIKNTKVLTNVSFNVYGKWNNNGEFTASDGTVKIVEGGTISGNNNFASFVFEKNGGKLSFNGKNSYKSLSIVAPGGEIKFAPGEENAQSVTESLILKGSKDSLMLLSSLPSSRNASQWFINCSNSEAADMRFIKVFDSYANKATSARLVALESRNGGNNINWQFPGLAIALTAAAIGQNQMYIVFDRAIDIVKSKLENTLYFINSEGSLLSDLKIQKATAIHNSTESTGFACSLSRTIQFEDILNVYVIYRSDGENYIATPTSDFMSDNESHALSDFAVNAVEPLYAYDNRQASLNSDYFKTGINIEESLAVHDWNEEQQKNGSLIYNSDIFIKVRKNYSTRLEDSDKTTEKISLYFDTEPDKDASSAYYNSIFGEKLRVWIPSVTSEGKSVLPIEMMARKNNVPKGTLTAESENSEFKYNFDNDSLSMSNGINSGDQVKFIFGLEDREICRVPIVTGDLSGFTVDASNKSPLFALRLKNSRDISSLDLWSFRLKEITSQRGGVTILNNVIDTSRGDIATVKVDMSGSGSLSVIVMTLDGNVVQYLQHGTASGGEHYYSWNGKTKGGKNVARGMYFVRVIGSGFDETRKIMVVRE
ncbi:MAG: hypothetical protein UHJ46_05095 [Treponema sp.]|nr:hypothetical protein [Treponema sp.]